jgi:DNA-binding MarR family transcriptional regulator
MDASRLTPPQADPHAPAAPGDPVEEIAGGCYAVRVRMLGRALTAMYDRALSDRGVSTAQLNILVFVGKVGACSPSDIGKGLSMERSTVSRNIRPLLDHGWLGAEETASGRVQTLRLRPSGRKMLSSVLPAWRRAQAEAATLLGEAGCRAVHAMGDRLWSRAVPTATRRSGRV